MERPLIEPDGGVPQSLNLTHRTVLISGGSRGIGLAIALRAAAGSTMPGTSSSARSATRMPVASGDVRRSGWSMPAENVTSTVSPVKSKSMRSPGL